MVTKYNECIIGVDQSYKRTGISIAADGKLILVKSIDYKGCKNNSDKRRALKERISSVILKCMFTAPKVKIICERIRLSSKGFININYIKSIGALNAVIVDVANEHGIEVCSVDTRSWKSQIVGTSKPKQNKFGIAPEKYPTICYVRKLGFDESIREHAGKKKNGVVEVNGERFVYNDDAADSACIALYGFLTPSKQKLEVEH